MNKVNIKGDAGYVGAVKVQHLIKQGFEVSVLYLNIYCDNGIVPSDFVEVDEIRNIESIPSSVSDYLSKIFHNL